MRTFLLLVSLCCPPLLAAQGQADSSKFLELGRRYTRWAYWGMADSLHPHLSRQLGAAVSKGDFTGFLAGLTEKAGNEVEVVSERVEFNGDQVVYTREAKYDKREGVRSFIWTMDRNGVVDRFTLSPTRP